MTGQVWASGWLRVVGRPPGGAVPGRRPGRGRVRFHAQGAAMLNYFDLPFTDEERLVQQTTREWVEAEALPGIGEHFERATFPKELIPRMGELGMLGASLPKYGAGLPYSCYGLICQELERCGSGLRGLGSVQSSLTMYPIHAYGSEEQKEKYLPKMVKGELIGCFGLTETDHGS